ncbi:hypothetical protein AB0B18_24275 [Micromonospora chalcea]
MSDAQVVIKLPSGEQAALQELILALDSDGTPFESRALDGGTLITAIVTITAPTILTLRTWMQARVAEQRGCTAQFDGHTFQGYTDEDISRLVSMLEKQLAEPRSQGSGENTTQKRQDH